MTLSAAQRTAWIRDGYLHVPGFLATAEVDAVLVAIDDIADRPDGDGDLMQHYEVSDDGTVQICRSEHLIESCDRLRRLLTAGRMPALAGELLGEPAVLYKEKVNYKLPGGAGFAPHQDAPAYPFITTHLTCMLAIDDATPENGCLEVVAAHHGQLLPLDAAGCIRPDIAGSLEWRPVPLRAGDLLWFHSRAPHRSAANRSPRRRRGLFCTYNAAADGDLRDAYYAEKLDRFARGVEGETTRVSLIGDFQGRAPRPEQVRELERRQAAVAQASRDRQDLPRRTAP